MLILIISDIHSNYAALEAVFRHVGTYDELWCLGDTIGYGPDPNECVAAMRQHASIAVCGNHDLACIGELDLDDFNPDARQANLWNRTQLAPDHHAWLEHLLPMTRVNELVTITHASPREPVWEYLLSPEQAIANASYFHTPICLIGHSHVQLCFRITDDHQCERFLPDEMSVIDLSNPNQRFFLNPGSVGQPRDYDPRAAYALLNTDNQTIQFHRVEYDIARTQKKMYDAQLPFNLIRRLEFGM